MDITHRKTGLHHRCRECKRSLRAHWAKLAGMCGPCMDAKAPPRKRCGVITKKGTPCRRWADAIHFHGEQR